MNQLRRVIVGLVFSVFLTVTFISMSHGAAAEFPTKPITVIVSYAPGGSIDLATRAMADAAKKYLGQAVICENKTGGGGVVGFSAMLAKPRDGYTLESSNNSLVNAWYMGNLKFHPVEAVTPVLCWGRLLNGLVVRADSPWKTLKEFLEYAKANPQKVTYGSPGAGTTPHLIMTELALLAGVQWAHVPFKGNVDANSSLLGGHVDTFCGGTGWAPLVDAGKFRLLFTIGDQRSSRYPNVPTLKELGYDLVSAVSFNGLTGPKGIPKPIADKLDDAFKKALYEPEVQAVMKRLDFTVFYLNSEDYGKYLRQEFTRLGDVMKKLDLREK